MPTVKIHELPPKKYLEIQDTNIMVLEDQNDTKQVQVADLKRLFSSDDKINAIVEQLNTKFNELRTELITMVKDLGNEDNDFEVRLNNLYQDHEQTKRKLGKVQEDLVDAQNNIEEIFDHLSKSDGRLDTLESTASDHEKRIKALESKVANHETRIVALEKDNETNKKNITQLQKDLKALSDHVDSEVDRLDSKIESNIKETREYAEQLYDQALAYIDYYHHIHEYPPNFDEPYLDDPIVARYIYPVGAIYQTVDPEFDVRKHFPGVWVYCGVGAAFDEDGNRMVDFFTYRRVE